MDRPDEGPPAKAPRLSSSEPPQRDPPPPPPPPPLLRLPLPPPQQRPRLQEETEAAQVLADMRGVGLGPSLPPPPPYVILEEGGIRAYFTLGAGGPEWEPAMESGFGDPIPPTGNLEALSPSEPSGGSLAIDFQDLEPGSFAEEKVLETCSSEGWAPQMLAGPEGEGEAVIIVEDDDEEEAKESGKRRRRRRRRRRKQRKVKESEEENAEKIECVLQALENIQLDLEAVNIKAGKAFLRLKRKFIQMRRPFLERRDLIIQHIPGFWVKASLLDLNCSLHQFLNHPKISILISQRDEDIFRYLTNLQVQDLRHISMGYKMKLYFQTNPYFTNMVIVKEFQCNHSGRLVSHSTPIRWHRGQEPQAHRQKNQDGSHSFFTWFSNHSLPEADRIAEIIKNDLWVNPLRYYMMGEGGYRTNKKKQEKGKRLSRSKNRDGYEVVILEDYDDYHIMEDIVSDTSDSDIITDFETINDVKISDFMETTDCFETTDNELTDINETFCDNDSPNYNENPNIETTDTSESPDDNDAIANNESSDDSENGHDTEYLFAGNNSSENPESNTNNNEENPNDSEKNSDYYENADSGNENPKGDINDSNPDSSDSDNEGTEDSDDEDNDDNEGSDDDGNEGDNEGSDDDDDDRDIEDYHNNIENPVKNQSTNNQNGYESEVENISEDSSSLEEEEEQDSEEDSELESEDSNEEEEESSEDEGSEEDSDIEAVLLVQNDWANPGKGGRTG
ncbi:testis-specific Y-encoded-like protein 2 isoform X1 [Erinaceus europaeus]|uniref:Testis-specific Y-encoded-like protein 2 isoform X1 n=1 Tax=Erinaceus europaeus TaxID=9365 RepID=A0ABM3WSG4_ERIEU|nr:testis-specific Y-encoded-like protein 2 isoform X1 [Erinaceus europaeus]